MKKLKWDELEAEKHYWLCCTENMHAEVIYTQAPPNAIDGHGILFHGDNIRCLAREFEGEAFFVEVAKPEGLGEGWF